jgi:hypothetical protein
MGIGKGITVFSILLGLVVLGGMYLFLEATPTPQTTTPKIDKEIIITHSSKDGVQRYIGEVTLAHSCFKLKQDTHLDPKNDQKRIIVIQSIDQMMDMRLCSTIPTKYPFDLLAESDIAPSNIVLILDGKEIPVRLREREWQNPIGNTVLDPIDRNK